MENVMTSNSYCVILAGGMGRRLWPCSRETHPKQFVDFFGVGRTQLQQTYDRFLKILPPENILVSTSEEYVHFVREQLPELQEQNILAEPTHRNTAPSVAWACSRIEHRCQDATIIVSPSDQAMMHEDRFLESVKRGLQFVAEHEGMLTLGVMPTRSEPGYGYIQMGAPTELEHTYSVKSFTEKPEHEFAKMFMDSGEFLWNTGIYLARVNYLIECFKEILPSVMRNIATLSLSKEEEMAYVRENFPRYPNLSIDYGILEKSDKVYVMQSHFGWADLGTWHSTYEAMARGADDNVVINAEVICQNSRRNIVKIPHDHLAVIHGLDGYIVAEEGNVLLICPKEDSSALLRKYVNEVRLKYGDEFV